jgi:aminoglycoside 6'-N-acetyltransferase I
MSLCEIMMGRHAHLAPPESSVVPTENARGTPIRSQVRIRPVRRADDESWAALRHALWPNVSATVLHLDIERWWWTGDRDTHCLVAEANRRLVGFIELSIRANAEGCETDRVAYVEGWYVAPDMRRRGIGRALMAAAEAWSRTRGCTELGSDSDVTNAVGQGAHRAFGFAEVATLVCFRKAIG